MPVHRSSDDYPRRSRRLSRQGPKSYDEDGFEHFDAADIFRYPSEPASVDTSASSSPPPSPSFFRRSEPYPTIRASHGKRKSNDHIPRPPNSFIVFRSHWWLENKGCPAVETDHREVSRIVGRHWRALSEDERQPFRRESEVLKREHALKYPGYKYAPGTRKSNKLKKKVSRDSRAEKAKCDKIVGDYFLQKRVSLTLADTEVKIEAPATPELVPSPPPRSSSPSTSAAAFVDELELIYPPSPKGFIPTDDIPSLDLSPPNCKVEVGQEELSFMTASDYEEPHSLNFAYNSNWDSHSQLGSPVPITPFPSDTSFNDCIGFENTSEIDLWNSTPPPVSPLFDPALLASNLSQSDYLLNYNYSLGTFDETLNYDQYFNL
ncbi:hypothetical protein C8R41DRAFT_978328 [Lentinula lateritia]|uniref:HMG box domain-containing protein n=1 Tax=Lentinula lateritia TaxID=40482 RepID=A0ABQ8VUL8_9AGAR|nr:hypothetical protein C8R41DRAFT_978328 [Lentinula lateritia]